MHKYVFKTTILAFQSPFNSYSHLQLKPFFRVSVNYGVFIKLTADILEIPCVGNNGIYIEEKGGRAGPFCAKKKMPAFVSRDVFFDIHIIVDTPLEVSLLNCRSMNFRTCQF